MGREIASARLAKDWSQTDLGIRMNLSQKSISRMELGEMATMGTGVASRVVGLGIGLIVEFDRVFDLPAGTLAARAGYLPAKAVGASSVENAIADDPYLSAEAKAGLLANYRAQVKARR